MAPRKEDRSAGGLSACAAGAVSGVCSGSGVLVLLAATAFSSTLAGSTGRALCAAGVRLLLAVKFNDSIGIKFDL